MLLGSEVVSGDWGRKSPVCTGTVSPLSLQVTSGGPGQCAWDTDHATLTKAPRLALTADAIRGDSGS